jgi:aspartyl-tRNA(Asn)/glutamyl-tRNA(Gln) amidotransferase subunit B
MQYFPTIGLEIHSELKTNTKMFCSCQNNPFVKEPNIYVCPVCLALPGALPTINIQAVKNTILIGQAINGQVAKITKWDRKHYFYPDLPKGYQISQYDIPLIEGGYLSINDQNIGIERIHLEEDTAKSIHTKSGSIIDYNRAGVPLVELVTKPDIKDGSTASLFAQEYQLILRTLGVSNADMEKGEMRVEVNISLAPQGQRGTKVEIKNLNSFKSVEKSINYEIERQKQLLEKGEKVVQETRGYNLDRGTTVSQRVKETSADYRYFPEPDLPPLNTGDLTIDDLPQLPQQIREELINLGLKSSEAQIAVSRSEIMSILNEVKSHDPKLVAKVATIIINSPDLAKRSTSEIIEISNLTSHQRKVFLETGKIIEEADSTQLEVIIKKVLEENSKAHQEYLAGKQEVYGYLVGQVMKEGKGQFDPVTVNQLLRKML